MGVDVVACGLWAGTRRGRSCDNNWGREDTRKGESVPRQRPDLEGNHRYRGVCSGTVGRCLRGSRANSWVPGRPQEEAQFYSPFSRSHWKVLREAMTWSHLHFTKSPGKTCSKSDCETPGQLLWPRWLAEQFTNSRKDVWCFYGKERKLKSLEGERIHYHCDVLVTQLFLSFLLPL